MLLLAISGSWTELFWVPGPYVKLRLMHLMEDLRGPQLSYPQWALRKWLSEGVQPSSDTASLGDPWGKGSPWPPSQLTCPWGLCSHTVLAFIMTEAAMTVSLLGNCISSCLHSSCTTLPRSPGPAAAASTSPGSSSKCPTAWALCPDFRVTVQMVALQYQGTGCTEKPNRCRPAGPGPQGSAKRGLLGRYS